MDVLAAPARTCPSGSEAGSGREMGSSAAVPSPPGGWLPGVPAPPSPSGLAAVGASARSPESSVDTGTRLAPAQALDTISAPVRNAAAALRWPVPENRIAGAVFPPSGQLTR